jgi:hypothetical protein
MGGLILIEPTTVLRDWMRTGLERPNLWAGGWPSTAAAETTGTVLHTIGSTLRGLVTTWSLQIDHWAHKDAPLAAVMCANTLAFLATTTPRTPIGATPAGTVLFGGLIEATASMAPRQPTSDDPDMYGHTLLCDVLTIAVPTPDPTP